MIAYKGFDKGLVCRGYKFKMGLNTTDKAQAVAYGFHCAENPLDCLTYYGDMKRAEYYIVNAGGDIDEDGTDTKVACTELTIIQKLTKEDFVLHALAYMADHPKRKWNKLVKKDRAKRNEHGFAIARGVDPIACGNKGDLLAFVQECDGGEILEVAMVVVDGVRIQPQKWYGIDLSERKVAEP